MNRKNHSTEPLSLRRNMLWNSAGSIVNLGCAWLMTVLVVRLSGGYQAAGVLALAMTVFNTFNPLVDFRMYTYQISDARHQNTTGEYLAFRLITSLAALVFATGYILITCASSSWAVVLLYFIYQLISNLLQVFHANMVLNSRMDYSGISNGLLGIGTLIAFVIVFGVSQSLDIAFISMALVVVAIGAFYTVPHALAFEPIRIGITKEKALNLFLTCFPLVLAAVACAACVTVPRQYLAIAQGDSLLGAYASVAAPAAIIQMGASYIYNPLLSTFARQYHAGEKHSLVSLLKKATIGIVLVGVVAGAILLVLGEWLLVLFFGEEIIGYLDLLLPVITMTAVTAFQWFFNDVLISIRQFRGVVIGNGLSFAVSLVLTFPLVNAFGANGVSFTVALAYMVGVLVFIIHVVGVVQKME